MENDESSEVAAPDAPASVVGTGPADASDAAASEPESAAVAEVPGVAPADQPLTPEYDWTGWDGTAETLPEGMREVATAVSGHYSPQMEALRSEVAELRKWGDLFKDDDLDPVIAEMTTKIDSLTAQTSTLTQERDSAKTQYTELEAAVEAEVEAETKRLVTAFETEHVELLKDPQAREILSGLINLGADPDYAAKVMGLGSDATDAFIDAKVEGANDALALKFAKMRKPTAAAAPVPTAAAKLIAGNGNTQRPAHNIAAPEEAKDLEGIRSLAVERAMRKHGIH